MYERFRIGYVDGSLLKTVPSKGGVKETLGEIGLLDEGDREFFTGCIVFPIFDKDDNFLGMIGQRIKDGKEFYLPDPLIGIFNWQAFIQNRGIIFTENVIDVLTLCQIGHLEAVPIFGELTEEYLNLLQSYRPERVYLVSKEDQRFKEIGERLGELNLSALFGRFTNSLRPRPGVRSISV